MLRIVLVVCLLCSSACSMTSVRHRQGFDEVLNRKTIAGMPAEIKVNMVGAFGSKERQYNYEEHLDELLLNEASKILKTKGYKVRVVSRKTLSKANNFDAYDDLKESIERVSLELYKTPMMAEEKAYNIDTKVHEPVSKLKKLGDGQVLLFIDYINNITTNGARVVNVLAGGKQAVDSSAILLLFLDANTGDVLWSNMVRFDKGLGADLFESSDHKERDSKHLHRILAGALANFPKKSTLD